MTPVLLRSEMRALDRIAIDEVGIPSLVLMEVAGRAVADAAFELWQKAPGPVLVLAGNGNNGGDAVVAARLLAGRGVEVRLGLIGDSEQRSVDLAAELGIAQKLSLSSIAITEPGVLLGVSAGCVLAIDGIFGTGLSRPVTGEIAALIEALNQTGLPVVAIDVPSGIDADTGAVRTVAVEAELTVTFQCPKPGLLLYPGRAFAGEVQVVDIGIPPSLVSRLGAQLELIDDRILLEASPLRTAESHKGSYGHLLVVAGVPDRPGAALLAARAGLRAGTGLVTLASDEITIGRIAAVLDELMGLALGPTLDAAAILAALEGKTALALGPSLSPTPVLAAAIEALLARARQPIVLDAGALTAFAGRPEALRRAHAPLVITPHPGEAAKLLGTDAHAIQSDRITAARKLAELSGAEVVLKGAGTVIASPDGKASICARGNAGMATGGTGDVLTGVIGGLLAQGVGSALAARAGVQIHAFAGDLAAESAGEPGLVASDLLAEVATVLRRAHADLSD